MMVDVKKIGKYEILEEIGRGGMGAVYRAYDSLIDREVAIKVILEMGLQIPEIKSRFYREARTAGKLSHENITIVHDVGEADGKPYIVMEYLTGSDLRSIIDRRVEMPLSTKVEYAIQICRGLAYSHSRDVIHRDIKPPNIRILDDGKVKIMDFGIAKPGASNLTSPGAVMGTPYYMSPEQIRGQKVDKRSDMFSFGVLFYEFLTLKLPFTGDEPTTVMYKIVHEEPEPISDAEGVYPPELKEIVQRTLRKNADERYQDFSDVAHDLEQILLRLRVEDQQQHEARKKKCAELIAEGERLLRDGNFKKAYALAEQAELLDTKNTGIAALLRHVEEAEEAERKKRVLGEKITRAGSFIRSQQFEQSLTLLREVLSEDAENAEALRLVRVAEDGLTQEANRRNAAGLIAQAWAEIHRSDVSGAERSLQEALRLDPQQPDAAKLQRSIKAEKANQEKKSARIESSLRSARKLLAEHREEKAISVLKELLAESPGHEEASRLLDTARAALKRKQEEKESDVSRKAGSETVLVHQVEAETVLAPAELRPRVQEDRHAKEPAVAPQRVVRPERKRPPGIRRRPVILIAAVAVFAVAAVVYGVFFYVSLPPEGYVSLNVLPWAEVTRIERESGGDLPLDGSVLTPCQLALPEGTYKVYCSNPAFTDPMVFTVQVRPSEVQVVTRKMPDFDPASIISQF